IWIPDWPPPPRSRSSSTPTPRPSRPETALPRRLRPAALLCVVAGVGEVEGAGGVEGLAGVAGEAAVEQDGGGVGAGAGLPDRECPVIGVAEVLDAAEL